MVSVHDQIIKSLETKLKDTDFKNDCTILTEHEYNFNGAHEADLLLIGPSGNYAYAIEVKTRNHKKGKRKAWSQLRYDRDFLKEKFDVEKIFLFYAYEEKFKNGSYEIHRYKPTR